MKKVRLDSHSRIVYAGVDKRHSNHILMSMEEFSQMKAELFQEIAKGDMNERKELKEKLDKFFELRFNN